MYTKDELAKLPIPELMEIANELGVKVSQDDELETVIYAILDKAAENSAAGVATPKRKRTRIAKDTNKVYTVNGSDGENLDAKATKAKKKKSLDTLFAEQEAAEQEAAEQAAAAEKAPENSEAQEEAPKVEATEEKPAPKKRGRKTKKELEAEAAAQAEAQEQTAEAEAATAIPEAAQTEPAATEQQEAVAPELLD